MKFIRVSTLLFFCFYTFYCIGQTLSVIEIKQIADEVDEKIKGIDIGNEVVARGCLSVDRTLIIQYDVPSFWEPSLNLKEEIIANLKISGEAKTYFLNEIDVDFYYFKGNSLVKKVSVKSSEFSTFNDQHGEYLSISEHVKSKGVNLKLKVPQGWEVKEGDRPNIVKKLTKDGNTYLILIKDNMTFFSRTESNELLSDESIVNGFVEGYSSHLKDSEVIDKSVVTIDTYPSLTFKIKGKIERSGIAIPMITRCWIVLYEDKIISLQAGGIDNTEFRALEQLYFLITNSVIFPDQYN